MITEINRYFQGYPNLVGITTTDDFATITAPGYFVGTQSEIVSALENGAWQWQYSNGIVTDAILIFYAPGKLGFFSYNIATDTFAELGEHGGVLPAPGADGTILRSNGSSWQVSVPEFSNEYDAFSILFASAENDIVGLSPVGSSALVSFTTGQPEWIPLINHQVVMGVTSGTPTATTLLAGTGITFTDAAGPPKTLTIASTASGTVSSGTINQIPYYASAGSTLTGFGTVANGVVVTNGSSVPNVSTTLPSGLSATNMTLVTPTLGVATATTLSFNPNTGGIVGVINGASASAGINGEVISSFVSSTSPVTPVSNTPYNITSINLTAGRWMVFGNGRIYCGGGLLIASGGFWVDSTSATEPDVAFVASWGQNTNTQTEVGLSTPFRIFNVTGPTTVYLSGNANFNGTGQASGGIYGVRF